MSPEHKQALMAGKERARAAREQADRERAHVSMTAACEVPPVDDVAKVKPAVVGNDAPQPATIDVLPAALSPATGTWISLPSAPEGQWRGVVARECPTSAFNLTSSARRLLMDALAAREPIVRLTPLLVGDSRLLGAQGAVREGVAVMARVEFPDAPITEQE